MSTLKTLKHRITAIRSTEKITKAMQMVAASKLKKSREKAEHASLYAQLMQNIVRGIASTLRLEEGSRNLLFGAPVIHTVLVVVLSSDRGLCGSFNASLLKFARGVIENHLHHRHQVKILALGDKAQSAMQKLYPSLLCNEQMKLDFIRGDELSARALTTKLIAAFKEQEIDRCELIYNHFKSMIAQVPTLQMLIPESSEARLTQTDEAQFTFDPSEEEILEVLLPKNIEVQIINAGLDSLAAENSSRMMAMDNATKNCKEYISTLRTEYNRTRQAQITKELIEIISGAEAI